MYLRFLNKLVFCHCLAIKKEICILAQTLFFYFFFTILEWSGSAMVLGKLPVPGHTTIWMIVGQGPIALAVGAGGGCLDIFTLFYLFSALSPSL